MTKFFKSLWRDEDGATAIEYGLLAALISVAIILAVTTLGTTLDGVFDDVNTKMDPTGKYAVAAPGGEGEGE
jgi:pilus assembly protein Flp/PilA